MNSFHAVCLDSEGVRIRCEPDAQGYISVKAGDVIRFADPRNAEKFVAVNSLVIFARGTPVKLQLGDNAMYPLYVGANERRGVDKLRIKRITVLQDCTFYYEGMTA